MLTWRSVSIRTTAGPARRTASATNDCRRLRGGGTLASSAKAGLSNNAEANPESGSMRSRVAITKTKLWKCSEGNGAELFQYNWTACNQQKDVSRCAGGRAHLAQ